MKNTSMMIAVVLLAGTLACAQDKPTDNPVAVQGTGTQAPKIHTSLEAENRILKAEQAVGKIDATMKDMSLEFTRLNSQLAEMRKQYPDLDKVMSRINELQVQYPAQSEALKKAQGKVDEAIDQAYKDAGLDKGKYTFDAATFTFTEKPPDKPGTGDKK